ncbi:MAG: hypothetical protein ACRD5H_05100 [Nitrososphaerales archaeon]
MEDETTGALIHEPDADGYLADPVTDRIVQAVSSFYPHLQFDPKNIKVTFEKAIASESDPKIKCLLQLIEGLYLARKQNNEEHNELFHRLHLIGKELDRIDQNMQLAFKNSKLLHANDQIVLSALDGLVEEIVKDRKDILKLETFKKKYEPHLNRLKKIIDKASDDYNKENRSWR